MATNEYGLDGRYFQQQLQILALNAHLHTPTEMRLALARLSAVAKACESTPRNLNENQRWPTPLSSPA